MHRCMYIYSFVYLFTGICTCIFGCRHKYILFAYLTLSVKHVGMCMEDYYYYFIIIIIVFLLLLFYFQGNVYSKR